MRAGLVLMIAAALSAGAAKAEEPAPKRVLVLDPTPNNVDVATVRTVAGLIAVEVNGLGGLDVITGTDVQKMVELEATKNAVGCTDASCLSELAGALGANLVVFGDVGRLGQLYVVNLSLFDSAEAKSLGRVSVRTKTIEELPEELAVALRRLFSPLLGEAATVAPAPPPSEDAGGGGLNVAALATLGGGAALVVGGAIAAAVGLVPYAGYEGAAAAAKDASSLAEYQRLDAQLNEHEAAYNGWGRPLVITGVTVASVGIVVAAAGGVWAALPGEE